MAGLGTLEPAFDREQFTFVHPVPRLAMLFFRLFFDFFVVFNSFV